MKANRAELPRTLAARIFDQDWRAGRTSMGITAEFDSSHMGRLRGKQSFTLRPT